MRQADRIILNTISNYALTILTMATQLIMVPVVIGKLGAAGYGLANIVLAPQGLVEVFSSVFARSMHRYIPQDLASNDPTRVSRTMTTAMLGYVAVGILGSLGVWLAFDWLLSDAQVTPELAADGRTAMWILVVWLVVGFPLWGYRKGLEAVQRYDLIGYSHGAITLARTVLVIVVFATGHGSATFFVATHLLALSASSLLCRWTLQRAVPAMKESVRLVNRQSVALIGAFAGAALVGVIGEVCGSYGFRIFIGTGLGLKALGVLAAVGTIQQTIARFIDELTNAFSPAISALDARGAGEQVAKLMLTGTKASMLACFSMCVVPLAAAGPFLHLWLGNRIEGGENLLYVFLLLMIPFCVGMTPTYVLFGLGRVTTTGTVMLLRGVGGLLLALAYVHWVNRDLVGATLCMLGVQNSGGVLMLFSACRAVSVRVTHALFEVLMKPFFLAAIASAVTWLLIRQVGGDRWWKLIVSVGSGEAVLVLLVLAVGLGVEERARIQSFFHRAWARVAGGSAVS